MYAALLGRRAGYCLFVAVVGVCGCEFFLNSGDHALLTDGGRDARPSEAGEREAGDDLDAGEADAGADSSPPDAGEPNPGIICGLQYCAPGAQACCVGNCSQFTQCAPPNDAGGFECKPMSGENCGWGVLQCDDSADCNPGGGTATVCCGASGHSRCIRLVDCQVQSHVVYCDPLAPMPCPEGAPCVIPDAGGRPRCQGI